MRYDIDFFELNKFAFIERVQINRYYRKQKESKMLFSRESTLNLTTKGVKKLFFKGETL